MDLDLVFSIASALALISWVVLFVFYENPVIYPVLLSGVIFFLAVLYLYFISVGLTEGGEGGFGSLDDVRQLFDSDHALLAGWIHYLVFDLFVGMWMANDTFILKINKWLLLPCLFFTFMMGPVGLLLYLIVRAIRIGKFTQYPFFRKSKKQLI
ncbi:ABA4-like family protein [Anditalea andensis]|uniref:Membrane protein n=1 Tax=Anditalea andensis TaxID=1048983 RepID=A0A074KTR8_9BACT|nr:ABA4-like family protein [Anditalea andensis]KEO73371.1 membrane protein [Anditalea andensis]